jgi:hypothetical protein
MRLPGVGFGILCVASFSLGMIRNAATILWLLPGISGIKAASLLLLYVITPEFYPTSVT